MRIILILAFFVATLGAVSPPSFAEETETKEKANEGEKEHFWVKGTVTGVYQEPPSLTAKVDEGLELTFQVDAATEITVEEKHQALSNLTPEQRVEIDYFYNENYEKVAQAIRAEF